MISYIISCAQGYNIPTREQILSALVSELGNCLPAPRLIVSQTFVFPICTHRRSKKWGAGPDGNDLNLGMQGEYTPE